MPDLTPVGLSKDGSRLVLRGGPGAGPGTGPDTEYTVVVDHRFRAALRGDDTRLAQLETPMETALRPRDIQARIRSGQSAEAVAAAARTTVDRIAAFAAPVLAERAHVAERAQRATIRRRAGDGPVGLLGETVAEQLRAGGVDPDTAQWDAWRRNDGRWTLVVEYRCGDSVRRAEFGYDAAGRYVVAEDDDSRRLVGETGPRRSARPVEATGAGTAAGVPAGSPVVADTGSEDPGQLALGTDAIELVTGRPEPRDAPPGPGDDPTTDLTATVAVVRALSAGPPVEDSTGPDTGDPAVQAPPEPGPAPTRKPRPARRPEPRAARRSRGRAAVPSWDEIMFGSGQAD